MSKLTYKDLKEIQDKQLKEILDALEESEKSNPLEIPKEVLINDKAFIKWLKGYSLNE